MLKFKDFCKRFQLTKKAKINDNALPEKPEGISNEKPDSFSIEGITQCPMVFGTPFEWCEQLQLKRVYGWVAGQSIKALFIPLMLTAVLIGSSSLAYLYQEKVMSRNIEKLNDVSRKIEKYGGDINKTTDLKELSKFIQSISVRDQFKGTAKMLLESGMIVTSARYSADTAKLPESIRNNFETASGFKIDEVKVDGVWRFGIHSVVKKDLNESWVINANKVLKTVFSNFDVNAYLDNANVDGVTAEYASVIVIFWNSPKSN